MQEQSLEKIIKKELDLLNYESDSDDGEIRMNIDQTSVVTQLGTDPSRATRKSKCKNACMYEDNNNVSAFTQGTYDARMTSIKTQMNSVKILLSTQMNNNANNL